VDAARFRPCSTRPTWLQEALCAAVVLGILRKLWEAVLLQTVEDGQILIQFVEPFTNDLWSDQP
jgi:hypothetical protein